MRLTGRRLTATLATVLAALVVIGAASAFAVGRAQRAAGPAGTGTPSTGATIAPSTPADGSGMPSGTADGPGAGTDRGTDRRGSSTGSTAPGASTGVPGASGSSNEQPTSGGADALQVTLSPRAEATAHAQEVADLVSRYFTSINNHDYDAWLTTVSTAQAKRDRDDWTTNYSTTHDSDVYISDITNDVSDDAGDDNAILLVRMQFRSHQAIEYAPTALPLPCVRWDVTYRIVDEGTGLRVGTSAQPPSMAPCE